MSEAARIKNQPLLSKRINQMVRARTIIGNQASQSGRTRSKKY
jgi:hypothetical protein